MSGAPLLAVAAASVAAFVLSSTWYAVLGDRTAALRRVAVGVDHHPDPPASATPEPWKVAVELLRGAVVAVILALGLESMGVSGIRPALVAVGVAWLAFPVVLLTGSVIWEDVPWQLAAIHAGDWLLKLALIAAIVTVWP